MPLVTVMVPAFNQESFIHDAIESAVAQDYPVLEIVVCDDCSRDRTFEIARSLRDERLRVFRNPANLGRVGNYRRLLHELARGDWVVNLDGDDYFTDRSFISEAMRRAGEAKDIVLVFARQLDLADDTGELIDRRYNLHLPPVMRGNSLLMSLSHQRIAVSHLTSVYRRREAIALDFYREDILSSDWESLFRLMMNRRVGFVDTVAGVWRHHARNATVALDPEKAARNLILCDSVCQEASRKIIGLPPSAIQRWNAEWILRSMLSFAGSRGSGARVRRILRYIRLALAHATVRTKLRMTDPLVIGRLVRLLIREVTTRRLVVAEKSNG